MAKSVIIADGNYTKPVKVTTLAIVTSVLTQNTESLMPVALSTFKSNRLVGDESFKSKIRNGVTIIPTYAKTDGVPIGSGSGGGTYWITG